jgi:hypothetical protein
MVHAANSSAAKIVMETERLCGDFRPWVPGLTPKEHIDMVFTETLLAAQNARAEAQAERERQWRKEDSELAVKNWKAARGNTVGVWCGVLFAIVMGIVTFVWTVYHTATSPPQTTHQTSIRDR